MRSSSLSSPLVRLAGGLFLLVGILELTLRPTQPLSAADPVSETGVIPPDAGAFATIHFAEVWQSETLKGVKSLIQKELPKVVEEAEALIGLKVDDVERISVFMPTLPPPSGRDPGFGILITTKKAYDPIKLLNGLDAFSYAEIEEQRNLKRPVPPKLEMKTAPIPKSPAKSPPSKLPLVEKNPDFEPRNEFPNGGPEEIQGKRLGELRLPPLGEPFYASKKNALLIYLVNDRSFALFPMNGREDAELYSYVGLLLRRSTTGNLSPALASVAKNQIVVGVDLKQASKLYSKLIPEQVPGRSLLAANSATLTLNLAKDVAINLAIDCPDADTAKSIDQAVNGLLTLARQSAPTIKKEFLKDESMKEFAPIFDQLETAIKNATCQTTGKSVNLALSANSETLFGTALTALVIQTRKTAERTIFINNFKQFGLAAHNFESAYGYFPFPGIQKGGAIARDPSKAILSWRVAILPYIEQEALYRQFDMNEPWDGPKNKKLIPLMPKIYSARKEAGLKEGETLVQMFSGAKGLPPQTRIATITDGLSNTFMVAEAGDPVIWTKPEDKAFDPEKPLPKLGGNFNGDFIVAFLDGSVRLMERKKVTDQILKWYIMPNDGNVIPFQR